MNQYAVRAIMRGNIPTLTPETPIRRAVAVLVEAAVPCAPVLGDDGRLVGILSQKDCFQSALHASYHREWSGQVADHMSREVVTIGVEEDVVRAAEMFLEYSHRVFPVVDGATVAGLLYRSDVLALLARSG